MNEVPPRFPGGFSGDLCRSQPFFLLLSHAAFPQPSLYVEDFRSFHILPVYYWLHLLAKSLFFASLKGPHGQLSHLYFPFLPQVGTFVRYVTLTGSLCLMDQFHLEVPWKLSSYTVVQAPRTRASGNQSLRLPLPLNTTSQHLCLAFYY